MADKNSKQPENVPGRWYVSQTCALCSVCVEGAPTLLKFSEDQSHVYFQRQPTSPEDETAAQKALEICPTGSIGNDGE